MKKIVSIVLVLLFLMTIFSACGLPLVPPNLPAAPNAPGSAESAAPAGTEPAAPAEGSGTPSGSYGKYIDLKGKAFERISAKIEEKPELALYSMTLLPFTMVDLSLLPLSVMTSDSAAAAAALSMMGMKDVKLDTSGGKYSVTYTDSEGNKITQTCLYDAATDSVQSTIADQTGKETMFFEYVKVGSGYAAQYYSVGDDENDVYTAFFDESNISAFGIQKANARPASIFKNTGVTLDLVKQGDTYMILQDGKLLVHDQGQDKTY